MTCKEQRTMTNLIHSQIFGERELSLLINSILLHEITDLVSRVEEVVIAHMVIVVSSKFSLYRKKLLGKLE
jgi:hypothetical protein